MSLGALAVLITEQISVPNALKSINFNIIGYLFGVFVIGQALEESGYLGQLSYHIFRFAKNPRQLILFIGLMVRLSW